MSLLRTLVLCLIISIFFGMSCKSKKQVDQIYYHTTIYTVDSVFSIQKAMAVKDGKIVATGTQEFIFENFEAANKYDLNGKVIIPGLYDAHTHFYYYALGLQEANLKGTKSFQEVITSLLHFSKNSKTTWIKGRGWDQNNWKEKEFPNNDTLNFLFNDRPVFLSRVDGHAALVNQKALDLAGITPDTQIEGGLIGTKIVNGKKKLTGVLIDNAMDLVSKHIPEPNAEQRKALLMQAQQDCFALGLTSVAEAGIPKNVVDFIDSLQEADILKIKIYAMLNPSDENLSYYLPKGPIFKPKLTISSFKVYADGALGSRGACLLKPYNDKKQEQGFLISSPETLKLIGTKIAASAFQMNTHCIGDSANRYILNLYHDLLGKSTDRRWRIEHAQVIDENDFAKFTPNNIIPSVQPTHATSDMYWVYDRLGKERTKNAYAYKKLINAAGLIAAGSDCPVEDINPFKGIYAAVTRQDLKKIPAHGFEPENKISRQQALRAFTIWAAYAGFEEKSKGSLENGKAADFIVIDKDIMNCNEYEIPFIQVVSTYSNGQKVYEK